MKNRGAIRFEHKKAVYALQTLVKKGAAASVDGPMPQDMNLYFQLHTIKETLEWVHKGLIKTIAKPTDPNYLTELMEHRYYTLGPVDAELMWPRATFTKHRV